MTIKWKCKKGNSYKVKKKKYTILNEKKIYNNNNNNKMKCTLL